MKSEINLSLTVHPKAEDFRRRNAHLQFEASRLLVERDDLKNSIVPQICAEYQIKIGALELRVFQFECEVRAFLRRIEMANAALNRGETFSYREIEREIKTEFSAWREQIADHIRQIRDAEDAANLPTLSRAESRELQTLYRKLAFSLHPDIVGSADERCRKLWLQAAEAYRNGDLQTLRTIRLLIETDAPENDSSGENILENLQTRHAELKGICEKLLGEISEIKTSEPFIRHKILDNPAELEKVQNDLREKIEILREKRRQLIEHWAEIMSFADDREEIKIPDEPADFFTETDFDWAEIIH